MYQANGKFHLKEKLAKWKIGGFPLQFQTNHLFFLILTRKRRSPRSIFIDFTIKVVIKTLFMQDCPLPCLITTRHNYMSLVPENAGKTTAIPWLIISLFPRTWQFGWYTPFSDMPLYTIESAALVGRVNLLLSTVDYEASLPLVCSLEKLR